MSRIVCATVVVLLWATMRVSAHHAFTAEYDENKLITFAGTVTLPDGRKLCGGFQTTPGAPK